MKVSAIVLVALALAGAAAARAARSQGRTKFEALERKYAVEFLSRNPVVATYLGGAAFDRSLAGIDGRLRDWSPAALSREATIYRGFEKQLRAIGESSLSPSQRIDRRVMLAQIGFVLHEDQERLYWRRCLDTYVNEPFRGVDWQLQGMSDGGGGRLGTEAEWRRVVERVTAIPAYLATARANIAAGVAADDWPDWRMVARDGLDATGADAAYFEKDLPEMARARTRGEPFSGALVADLDARGKAAGAAYRELRQYLVDTFVQSQGPGGTVFRPRFRADRFACGEKEYAWRLAHALQVTEPLESIWKRADALVEEGRRGLVEAARKAAEARGMHLPWGSEEANLASTRRVLEALSGDYAKNDEELLSWYRDVCRRLVAFGRDERMFEVPGDYRLDVVVTPPQLEASIDGAAYYPAPPFKSTGVGRFYVTPTHGDVEQLKQQNRASLADLAAHEGFPGHDWHYKVMTRYRSEISPVRWFTPGEVEGSSSMWEDSMAAEGWAHYAERLMGEAEKGAPEGFYTPDERVYERQGALYRDVRVKVDIGIHTGRMSYDEAVDYFSRMVDFLPGSCRGPGLSPEKKASCDSAERAIFRYSKWPTQAITYRLGKERILDLRAKALELVPGPAGERRFHLLFMKQGTIPPDFFGDVLLAQMKK